jgi:hypothetical protein
MRLRRFRPFVEQLDSRIVFDAASAAAAAAVTPPPVDNSPMPGDDIDLSDTIDWNMAGNPPADTDDPTDPSINLTIQSTTPTNPTC